MVEVSFTLKTLEGTFTIGGENPDFENFTAAANELSNSLVTGKIVFNVRDGIYNEQVLIHSINGADSLNTVTFQSESGDSSQVILTYHPEELSARIEHQLTIYIDYEYDFIRQNDTLVTTIYNYPIDTTYFDTYTCDPNQVNTIETQYTNQYGCDSIILERILLDQTPPVANCHDLNLALDANNFASINVFDVNNNSTDNCGIASVGLSMNTFNCSHLGENIVELIIGDQAGNQSTCQSVVTVQDTGHPQANCIDFLNITLLENEPYILNPAILNAQSTDNCRFGSRNLSVAMAWRTNTNSQEASYIGLNLLFKK